MNTVPAARHLLRAKDLVDARYRDQLNVPALAQAAHLSPAHFSREFRRVFGETPHQYLLTRRLERAAALLRNTDRSVVEICLAQGLPRGPSGGRGPGPDSDLRAARLGAAAVQQFSRRQPRTAWLTSRPSV